MNLQSSRYRTDTQNKPIQTKDLIPIVNDLEALSAGGGGSTIVTAPFVPDNSTIIVGDTFQEVAEKAQGQIDAIITDVTNLGNNEYKIAYYAEINAASGTISKPVGSTIMLDQFYGGVDAVISTISGGKPSGEMPVTTGGTLVDVTTFDALGNFVLSGIPSSYPCALIYTIKISAANYASIDLNYVIEYAEIGVQPATQAEVNTGTNTDKFVTPDTLKNSTQWATKQDTLVSGSNIKTINGSSVLGAGNLEVSSNSDYNNTFLLMGA